jgi:hypothetical protein
LGEVNITQPAFIRRFTAEDFQSDLCCLGEQLVELLSCIKKTSHLSWYVFDALGGCTQPVEDLFAKPMGYFENADELIEQVKHVVQFESGVFIGINPNTRAEWNLEYLPETEEIEGLQHESAEIEIRAFDFSYFEVYGADKRIENDLNACFTRVSL